MSRRAKVAACIRRLRWDVGSFFARWLGWLIAPRRWAISTIIRGRRPRLRLLWAMVLWRVMEGRRE